jgi:Flp pilus assembly protein TadD
MLQTHTRRGRNYLRSLPTSLLLAGLFSWFGSAPVLLAADCKGPAPLEARIHAHPEPRLYAELAASFEQNKQSACAFQTYTHAIHLYPSSAGLTNALVLFLASHNQLDDAYRLASTFATRYPRDPEAQKVYLRVLVATNDANTASPLARKLLAAAPHDSELLYLNGVLERKAGDDTAARAHLQQSIALTPKFAESHYNLALVLENLHESASAKEQFDQAIALGVNEPEVHLELSKTLRTLGETTAADQQMQIYQQTLQASANREIAAAKTADADQALTAGDAAKAVSLYREALEATPASSTQDAAALQYKLSVALARSGDVNGERAAVEQAVQLDPGLAVAQHQLGYLIYSSGDYGTAAKHFQLAVQDDPSFTQAWISLAATLAATSQFAEARDAAAHALRLDPHNPQALELKQRLAAAR